MKIKTYQIITASLTLIGVCFFLIPYFVTQYQGLWEYNQGTALIGDTLGGVIGPIIAFIGVILTFFAFYIQYEANNVQRKALFMDQFESKFFELIRMHRENVARIVYDKHEGLIALKHLSIEHQNNSIHNLLLDNNFLSTT